MNIGIILYSQTGNTLSVAQKLQEKLAAAGHSVTLERIEVVGDIAPGQAVQFKTVPDAAPYEALVLGGPVQAFSLNPVMKAYLEKLPAISGKKVAVYVTKQLPLLQVGGTGAIAHMKKACAAKGGTVVGSEIVVWAEKKRDKTIKNCVDQISGLF